MSQKAYFKKNQAQQPIVWIYYGFMIIMVVYNLFIFIASRDRNYILYAAFITCYILFQMTLNGYSFQYLWPNAVWWNSHSLPFFMCASVLLGVEFIRRVLEIPSLFKPVNKIFLYVLFPSVIAWAVMSLMVNYSLAIKVATALVGVIVAIAFLIAVVALFRKSRAARFITAGFFGLASGVLAYVLKTFAVLPEMFITEWGIQIGSSMVVVFLSLLLADKINVMRRDLKVLLLEQQESEKLAKERTAYLEGVVGTATGLTQEFIRVSGQLEDIAGRFAGLSMEQSATSEEMSATFEELLASVDTIYRSTITQKDEGEKSKNLAEELSRAQKGLVQESVKVEESIRNILHTAGDTGESLRKMTDTMQVINTGGKEINQFIAMIDDISDRINLLSLNAAIEAARAGDYGRGFAVVADEIGKLAQATSENSKEIARKISKIIADIEVGARIVSGTKESTDAIFGMVNAIGSGIDSVRKMMGKQNQALEMVIRQAGIIDTMSQNIVTSTNEQKSSMEQTQKTIDRLSEMAQEISRENGQIIDFSRIIHEKARQLNNVITGG